MSDDNDLWGRIRKDDGKQQGRRTSVSASKRRNSLPLPSRPTAPKSQQPPSSKTASAPYLRSLRKRIRPESIEEPVRSKSKKASKTRGGLHSIQEKVSRHTIVIGVIACVAVGGIFLLIRDGSQDGPQSLGITSGELSIAGAQSERVEEVAFQPFYPTDFDTRGIEFTQRKRADVEYVTYVDTIDGVSFTVTQQMAPDDVAQGGEQQVEKLAQSLPISAEEKFQVDDTMVFVGVSSNNKQTLTFSRESVLVFVNADGVIAESFWAAYLGSLIQ